MIFRMSTFSTLFLSPRFAINECKVKSDDNVLVILTEAQAVFTFNTKQPWTNLVDLVF